MATVEYQRIGKSFGAFTIMRDISFKIADQDFVVLLGPSGCGKTTLLRMTAGLESVSEGDLLIDGNRVNTLHPRDRNIAMVFQNYALYPTMKVYDNISFSLEVAKIPPAEIKRRVEWAAETLNLTPYLDRYPKELSGGQRQRVAMGRAMVREAAVFLFDEPLSNLDAKLRAHMRTEIRQLHNRLKTTTVYVTHDQIEAMTMADKIVVMRAGKIEQIGSPDEVYDRPASKYVADFIGASAINFLPGTVVVSDGMPAVDTATGRVVLETTTTARPGEKVVIGLRPTDVVVDGAGALSAKSVLVERLGHDAQLFCDGADGRFTVSVDKTARFAEGSEVRFSIPPSKVHVFNAETEARL
ncbi:multiple sugar transport system ATP-binding protein [Rhizobium sp. PP-F2F-G38]|uniref:Sn-glycerol-3-phosphate ABC transporter ATP-binding protein UgpC n=1 Tax=Ferranicluibacter rubi TaxID=2715133 RepID=A0AA44CA54_9HYPH|nr:sn-glycerol-3-phosphate ABC transporter ATP-binding protein UgpC [Ferranicluibacter rubi]NHT75755.1 sn-glycerol-3-phosphate ABC transporter ATP-binding protein UgpC [Ferranicluibacter rubi]PYE32567.1 multiple sugar transport system ATP-binding protein [Rhizobium sp. PP-WC-1G-195]PYE95996.1 multiple sugar transport system ATP-binding protein [Rhizobium sp. PP-F2F-G38]TCP88399.1 multiple sugar transport system ATP-binding protein [Rhizobium sp. PP-CC-2G-626]